MNGIIGKKLDNRYEIMELVGVGGMSNVYKAFDLNDDKIVAIKILKSEFVEKDEFLVRFKNESKAIAVLSHPNVVKVFDVNFSEKYNYIVMEFVDGITLKDYIRQEKVVDWKEVVHFTTEILMALQHAHDKGIIHRDIKPHNVMLLPNGNIKIMDFGIARFARSDSIKPSKKTVGSVHYISPEQAQGNFTDQKTDIYSLGVTMYELLSGELPFEGDTAVDVAIKQISHQPKRLREVNPSVPEGLEAIVIKTMQKVPTKRYHSASEMLLDISEFKKNPAIDFLYKNLVNLEENEYYKKINKKSENFELERKKVSELARKSDRYNYSDEAVSTAIPIAFGVVIGFILAAVVGLVYFLIIKEPFAKIPDITVPTLEGETEESAVEIIRAIRKEYSGSKISLSVERGPSDEYLEGIIFFQDPKPNRTMKADSIIKIKISTGKNVMIMPDFRNVRQSEAVAQLNKMGLSHNVRTEHISDENIESGYIISANIEPNQEIDITTEIILYVSMGKGEKLVAVPDLVGLADEKTAKELLESFNLEVGTVSNVVSDKPKGSVVSQIQKVGSEVAEGTKISFAISEGVDATDVNFKINLPYINREVEIVVEVDDVVVIKEYLVPAGINSVTYLLTVKDGSSINVSLDQQPLALYNITVDDSGQVSTTKVFDNTSTMNEM